MKQHLFGFVGLSLAVALAAGCKSNPQSSLDNVPKAIKLTASHIVVYVADSVRVDAQVVDAQGTPLTTLPDASSNDPGVVSLSTIDPYPVPETSFWVKGETFGAGTISVTSGSLSATITVQTYPKSAKVGNAPADTILSGTPTAPYPIALDANGDSIAAPADSFSWTVDHSDRLSVDPATGAGLAKLDGAATITLHVAGGGTGLAPTIVIPDTNVVVTTTPDSAVHLQYFTLDLPAGTPAVDGNTEVYFASLGSFGSGGRVKAALDTTATTATHLRPAVPSSLPTDSTYDVVIEGLGPDDYTVMTHMKVTGPLPFNGTFSTTSPNTADIVTATVGTGDPLFDADTKVTVGGVAAFIDSVKTDGSAITFVIPQQLTAGATVPVAFTLMGADQKAETDSVTINAVATDDAYNPANNLPATAPVLTADGKYYVLLVDTDSTSTYYDSTKAYVVNYFTVTAGATQDSLSVVMDWDAPGATTGNIDLWACTGTCSAKADFAVDSTGQAATTKKPEKGTYVIPAGQTWHFAIVQKAVGVKAGDLVEFKITGF